MRTYVKQFIGKAANSTIEDFLDSMGKDISVNMITRWMVESRLLEEIEKYSDEEIIEFVNKNEKTFWRTKFSIVEAELLAYFDYLHSLWTIEMYSVKELNQFLHVHVENSEIWKAFTFEEIQELFQNWRKIFKYDQVKFVRSDVFEKNNFSSVEKEDYKYLYYVNYQEIWK